MISVFPMKRKELIVVYDGEYLGSNPQYGMYVRPFTTSGNTISFGTQDIEESKSRTNLNNFQNAVNKA